MSLATVLSRAPAALQSPLVRVEVHLAPGLPAINLVGLPESRPGGPSISQERQP